MQRTKLNTKQAISPVIATILLIAITVIIAITTFQFLQTYTQDSLDSTSNNQLLNDLNTKVVDANEDRAYVQTPYENLNISRVILDGFECTNNSGVSSSKTLELNLSSCSGNVTSSRPQLTIESNEGIIQLQIRELRAVSSSSSGGGGGGSPSLCTSLPGNWTEVPGNAYFSTSDFCVMEFEAKDVGGVATSQPSETPWTNIDFPTARAACNQLNTEHSSFSGTFRMITNREWMTIARDAELQEENWADGIIGSEVSSGGGLKRGNVGQLDSVSYDGANPADRSLDTNTKAMLTLSNGETIWDLSGNVWEWTDMLEDGSDFNGNACSGTDSYYSYFGNDGSSVCTFNAPFSKDSAADTRYEMGPLGDYNADNGVGRIYSDSANGRALLRGGRWNGGVGAGAFYASLITVPSNTLTRLGFRCSYEP